MRNLRFVVFELSPYRIHSGIWVILHSLRLPLDVNHRWNVVSGFYCEGGPNERGLSQRSASSLGLVTCGHEKVTSRSIAFLQTNEFYGWDIIEHL